MFLEKVEIFLLVVWFSFLIFGLGFAIMKAGMDRDKYKRYWFETVDDLDELRGFLGYHKEFMVAVEQWAKDTDKHVAEGGELSDLPAPPKFEDFEQKFLSSVLSTKTTKESCNTAEGG